MEAKLRAQIKEIGRKANQYQVRKLNAMILGMHGYYKTATMCTRDFAEINYIVRKGLRVRLRRYTNKVRVRKKKPKAEPMFSKTYQKLYGDYGQKPRVIAGIAVFPIYGCKFHAPRFFTQEINKYTEEGRQLIHNKLTNTEYLVRYLLNSKEYGKSVEYNDNRISLIAGQNGKCFITGEPLEIDNMECHHKVPKELGGTDEYSNLVWLSADAHKLIHATQPDIIGKYSSKLNLDTKALKKVNSLRLSAENLEIVNKAV